MKQLWDFACAKGFIQVRATLSILVIYMRWAFKLGILLFTCPSSPAEVLIAFVTVTVTLIRAVNIDKPTACVELCSRGLLSVCSRCSTSWSLLTYTPQTQPTMHYLNRGTGLIYLNTAELFIYYFLFIGEAFRGNFRRLLYIWDPDYIISGICCISGILIKTFL